MSDNVAGNIIPEESFGPFLQLGEKLFLTILKFIIDPKELLHKVKIVLLLENRVFCFFLSFISSVQQGFLHLFSS